MVIEAKTKILGILPVGGKELDNGDIERKLRGLDPRG